MHHRRFPTSTAIIMCLIVWYVPFANAQDGQDECRAVLAATEAAFVQASYSITNAERDGWLVQPDSASDFAASGTYTERSEWLTGENIVSHEIGEVTCTDGAMVITGSVATELGTITQTAIRFEPALTWLQFPLEAGTSWMWSGTYLHSDGEFDRQYPARMYGFATDLKTVETPVGSYECREVTTELTMFVDTAQQTYRTESCISFDPYYLVVERTRQLIGLTQEPAKVFTLETVQTGRPTAEPINTEAPPK